MRGAALGNKSAHIMARMVFESVTEPHGPTSSVTLLVLLLGERDLRC